MFLIVGCPAVEEFDGTHLVFIGPSSWFVTQKESTSILCYWRSLYSLVMEISEKALCIFSSGCRVKDLEKVGSIRLFNLLDMACILLYNSDHLFLFHISSNS